jgi:hypothetical protein
LLSLNDFESISTTHALSLLFAAIIIENVSKDIPARRNLKKALKIIPIEQLLIPIAILLF